MIQLNNPIFLNVEYTSSFIQEYPICASKKNIVLPYPTTDPDLFSGSMYSKLQSEIYKNNKVLFDKISHNNNLFNPQYRDKLIFYHGGNHGSCVHIRTALNEIMKDNKYSQSRGDKKREIGFATAKFCPIPIGT